MIGLKKGRSQNKWFRHRSQICAFSGLVIGWWSKLWAAHPYPTQSWVPPWDCHIWNYTMNFYAIVSFNALTTDLQVEHFSFLFSCPCLVYMSSLLNRYSACFGCERLWVRVPSVPMLSWKLSVLEIPLDNKVTSKMSCRNLYKTRGADSACDGWIRSKY